MQSQNPVALQCTRAFLDEMFNGKCLSLLYCSVGRDCTVSRRDGRGFIAHRTTLSSFFLSQKMARSVWNDLRNYPAFLSPLTM